MEEQKGCKHHTNNGANRACVSLVPIFNHLETEQMDEIMQVIRSQSLKKGECIYHAGDKSDSLYIVNRGQIKIYRLSESVKLQIILIFDPVYFNGELALSHGSIHELYVEVFKSLDICIVNRQKLQALLMMYPTISLKIMQELAN